jgi:CHAT domain
MPPSTSAVPDPRPIHIELELVRAEAAEDAFAFRFARQKYLIRGPGGAYETAELPWSRELLRDLEEIRRPDRDPATVARVGDMLRELLGPAGWARHEATIVDARAQRRHVHLTIRSAAAELYALPWELLTLRADGQHLGALDHVLLRYAWPGTSTVAAETGNPAGRLLLAWSAAGGGIPAAEQTKAIQAAATAAERDDAVEVLPRASYVAIAEALDAADAQGRPFTVLHLLCHGAEAGSTFGLSLDAEGGEGRPAVVDAGRLQQLLAPHAHGLRLVVVAACDGGNMGEPGNRIGSVAQRLHRAGLQYVIASRYPLSARGSTRATGALHQALLAGASVERAFVEARTAASREVGQLDWASLQLYARPEDGDRGCVLAKVANAAAPVAAEEGAPAAATAPAVAAIAPETQPRKRGKPSVLAVALALVVLGGIALFVAMQDRGREERNDANSSAGAHVAAPAREPTPSATTTAPSPEPIAATSGGAEPGTSGGAEPSTSGGAETATTTKPKPKPKPKPVPGEPAKADATPRSNRPCSRLRKNDLRDWTLEQLQSPGGRHRVKLQAEARGRVVLAACEECNDQQRAQVIAKLELLRLDTLAEWKDELPCYATLEWQ